MTGENMVMPVSPYGNGDMGGFGNGWWIILLFLAFGGWGNGFGGGAAPYVNGDLQRGFDQAAVTGQISALSTAVTSGFADQAVSQCNQTTNILQGLNNIQNQISNDRFDTVSAITNTGYQLNNTMLQNEMARQQCCCETKQAIADLKYTIATENCQDRAALTASTQAILDKMCASEIESYKRENENLRTQLNMASLAASQTAQTAALQAGNVAQTTYLVDALRPTPIPAYIVANPNTGTTTPATGA